LLFIVHTLGETLARSAFAKRKARYRRKISIQLVLRSIVTRTEKLLEQILRGNGNANIPFTGLAHLLLRLGFTDRIRGNHH
jgi:hypothetical protein